MKFTCRQEQAKDKQAEDERSLVDKQQAKDESSLVDKSILKSKVNLLTRAGKS